MEFKIRFAEVKDMAQIIVLCKSHAEYEQSDYAIDGKLEMLQKHIFHENPSVFCIVVESGKDLLGYATYAKQFSTWDANNYFYMDCLYFKRGNQKSRNRS